MGDRAKPFPKTPREGLRVSAMLHRGAKWALNTATAQSGVSASHGFGSINIRQCYFILIMMKRRLNSTTVSHASFPPAFLSALRVCPGGYVTPTLSPLDARAGLNGTRRQVHRHHGRHHEFKGQVGLTTAPREGRIWPRAWSSFRGGHGRPSWLSAPCKSFCLHTGRGSPRPWG